jgi:hypothetical protein
MEPTKLSQTIEENLVELFSWLYLFPITMVDLVRKPLTFVDRMEVESSKTDSSRFDARMSPMLFLVAGTVPLSVVIVKGDPDSADMPSVADAALVIALTVAAFPFVWALCSMAASGKQFGRKNFREAFGTQCYVFCPGWSFVLVMVVATQHPTKGLNWGLAIGFFAAIAWTAVTEWRLLRRASSWLKGSAYFIAALFLSALALKVILALSIASHQKWLYNPS